MDSTWLPAVFWITVSTLGVGAAILRARQQRQLARRLELAPSDDWGLSDTVLLHDNVRWGMPGVRGKVGRLRWTHEALREGQSYLVCSEQFGGGKSTLLFWVVVTDVDPWYRWLLTAGHQEGEPPAEATLLLWQAMDRRLVLASLAGQGRLLLRARKMEDLDELLELAVELRRLLDKDATGATQPGAPTRWEQPPA